MLLRRLLTMTSTSTHAWGIGLATLAADGSTLDTWYPAPQLGEAPADPTAEPLHAQLAAAAAVDGVRGTTQEVVVRAIELAAAPADASDAYLRLHLLSHRLVEPNAQNLDGLFGALTNVVWTTEGPCAAAGVDETRLRLRAGGGASTMGTLSGGGTERVRIGKRSLVGAEAGVGIALGDDCVVEAGLYITAGTKVTLVGEKSADAPHVVKARELSGVSNLLFRRNSLTGAVEAVARAGQTVALNAALHAN